MLADKLDTIRHGRSFFVGFLHSSVDQNCTSYIVITTQNQPSTIFLNNFYLNQQQNFNISSHNSTTIAFNHTMENTESGSTSKLVYIVSSQDITVATYQMCDASGDGMLALPLQFYDRQYVIATYRVMNTGQFLILSNGISAVVNISFPYDFIYNNVTYSRQNLLTVTIQMSKGFYIEAKSDLTGTIITSDQSIAVITGSTCATGSSSHARQCSNMMEQLLPNSLLGKSYILSPLSDGRSIDVFRVVAAHNNTNVQIQYHNTNHTLLQGEFYELEISNHNITHLACDKPCLLVQYTYGRSGNNSKDQLVMVTPPAIENYDYLNIITIPEKFANENRLTSNLISITIPDKQKNDLNLNGKPLDNVDWKYIKTGNNVTYAVATINVDPGINVIKHTHYAHYGLIQHGIGQSGSTYGLSGNVRVPKITQCKYSILN